MCKDENPYLFRILFQNTFSVPIKSTYVCLVQIDERRQGKISSSNHCLHIKYIRTKYQLCSTMQSNTRETISINQPVIFLPSLSRRAHHSPRLETCLDFFQECTSSEIFSKGCSQRSDVYTMGRTIFNKPCMARYWATIFTNNRLE